MAEWEEYTQEEINTFIAGKINEYKGKDPNSDLQEAFQKDFKGFTLHLFNSCNRHLTRNLRKLLQTQDTDRNTTIAQSLFEILQAPQVQPPLVQKPQSIRQSVPQPGYLLVLHGVSTQRLYTKHK
jgi:hypothetical protein